MSGENVDEPGSRPSFRGYDVDLPGGRKVGLACTMSETAHPYALSFDNGKGVVTGVRLSLAAIQAVVALYRHINSAKALEDGIRSSISLTYVATQVAGEWKVEEFDGDGTVAKGDPTASQDGGSAI